MAPLPRRGAGRYSGGTLDCDGVGVSGGDPPLHLGEHGAEQLRIAHHSGQEVGRDLRAQARVADQGARLRGFRARGPLERPRVELRAPLPEQGRDLQVALPERAPERRRPPATVRRHARVEEHPHRGQVASGRRPRQDVRPVVGGWDHDRDHRGRLRAGERSHVGLVRRPSALRHERARDVGCARVDGQVHRLAVRQDLVRIGAGSEGRPHSLRIHPGERCFERGRHPRGDVVVIRGRSEPGGRLHPRYPARAAAQPRVVAPRVRRHVQQPLLPADHVQAAVAVVHPGQDRQDRRVRAFPHIRDPHARRAQGQTVRHRRRVPGDVLDPAGHDAARPCEPLLRCG